MPEISLSRFNELILLVQQDLELRSKLVQTGELFGDYHPLMEALHTSNGTRLETLIDSFGWPILEIDGPEVLKAAWLIVMHAISLPALQKKALNLLRASGGCSPEELAMLEDRILVFSGMKQKFGTQFDWSRDGCLLPYPIENIEFVDERRCTIGLPPLSDGIERLRERARLEGEKPPSDYSAYLSRRESWMLRAGWIYQVSDIDEAFHQF
ncbi:MAG: hypothetical protein Q8922_03960 [Bacteroidota bacterium]|nr:hypothetical protein [Bacteroidota bacterium]MDP4233449.1 hypothetical protein [Bacteroidota bacterium]MDP4242315.1 hypothetical protein [Bacteroidota bacterium]MDP4287071.1 hypothetical protein [Bacteroidota bacterium]